MEKETLEEISKEMYKGEYMCNGIDLIPVWREGFILGAEFQQERSYSEEEVIDLLYKRSIYQDHFESDVEVREWFEKFKKK